MPLAAVASSSRCHLELPAVYPPFCCLLLPRCCHRHPFSRCGAATACAVHPRPGCASLLPAATWVVFIMEHGSITDSSSSTFSLVDEDHTLANAVRYTLNQDPRVAFCGYSIPHPSDNRVNIRVQTTGDPAKDVLKDALQDLMVMCQHVRSTFDKAVEDARVNQPLEKMTIDG